MIVSSLFLSRLIAAPVQKLAEAADRVRSGYSGRETIPSMEERGDEIGELSASLSAMTRALYDRIDAIESFAADVAHELKNPLTSLRNAVGMLSRLKESDDVARERMLRIIRDDVKRIDRLITDISDASRLDAELSREANTPVDLVHLLNTLVEIYSVMDDPREINMAIDLHLPQPTYVLGHDERLGQVFRNLIDNAISFSPPKGTVTIRGETRGRLAVVMVEDEGPGVPPDNLETIFDRFYTERSSEHFGHNSGLGLSIARQIVKSMGGRIWAENRATPLHNLKGARFIVEFPMAPNI
jgi:two-component system sensor histidine kinase ChvG